MAFQLVSFDQPAAAPFVAAWRSIRVPSISTSGVAAHTGKIVPPH